MHYNSPEFARVLQPVPSKLKKFPPKFKDFNPGLGALPQKPLKCKNMYYMNIILNDLKYVYISHLFHISCDIHMFIYIYIIKIRFLVLLVDRLKMQWTLNDDFDIRRTMKIELFTEEY